MQHMCDNCFTFTDSIKACSIITAAASRTINAFAITTPSKHFNNTALGITAIFQLGDKPWFGGRDWAEENGEV